MAILAEYIRPASLAETARILADAGERAAVLAGGAQLIGELETRARPHVEVVVDLCNLGLNQITAHASVLRIGATATLAQVSDHPIAGALAGGLLRRAAAQEGPLNLRNVATIGGVIATAASDSEVYAALLALDASVTIYSSAGSATLPLAELAAVDGLITEIQLPLADLRSGLAHVVRTPADRPIAAALAVRGDGVERVALCGVAARPVLAGSPLAPPDDFKGSSVYRAAMAEILSARALAEAGA